MIYVESGWIFVSSILSVREQKGMPIGTSTQFMNTQGDHMMQHSQDNGTNGHGGSPTSNPRRGWWKGKGKGKGKLG